jgi:hypothetical protein
MQRCHPSPSADRRLTPFFPSPCAGLHRVPPKLIVYPTVVAPLSGRVHDTGVARPVRCHSSRSSAPRVIEMKLASSIVAVYPSRGRHPRGATEPSPFPVPPCRLVRSLMIFSSTWGRIYQSHASSLPEQPPPLSSFVCVPRALRGIATSALAVGVGHASSCSAEPRLHSTGPRQFPVHQAAWALCKRAMR